MIRWCIVFVVALSIFDMEITWLDVEPSPRMDGCSVSHCLCLQSPHIHVRWVDGDWTNKWPNLILLFHHHLIHSPFIYSMRNVSIGCREPDQKAFVYRIYLSHPFNSFSPFVHPIHLHLQFVHLSIRFDLIWKHFVNRAGERKVFTRLMTNTYSKHKIELKRNIRIHLHVFCGDTG